MAQKTWLTEQRKDAIRELQERTLKTWQPYPGLKRYLADCWPETWQRVRRCSMSFKALEDVMQPGREKWVPYRCHEDPFCITCAGFKTWQRTQNALDKFHRCTPKGKKPRFIHIVQTAMVNEQGQGWGNLASENVKGFAGVVWRTLREEYGDGIGAFLSYHDFGERAFRKRSPHIDLTLNGWMLQDDEPVHTPLMDLAGPGRRKWDERYERNAGTVFLGSSERTAGNLDVGRPKTGIPSYAKILKYQVRELVDLRKLRYDRDEQTVDWLSYRTGQATRMTVTEFGEGLWEYRERLGAWKRSREPGPRVRLHRAYGHLSDRLLRATQKAMDGEPMPHGASCTCSKCRDWQEAILTDEEVEMNRSRQLNVPGSPSW